MSGLFWCWFESLLLFPSFVWISGGATERSWPQFAPSAAMSRTWSRAWLWWGMFSPDIASLGALTYWLLLLLKLSHFIVFDCRVSGTRCAPSTPISPSTLSSRRTEAWSKSGTFWERSTFAVLTWGRVRLQLTSQNCSSVCWQSVTTESRKSFWIFFPLFF